MGTGINASLYPRDCEVTGIDLCESMLENAGRRIARHRLTNIRLMQMDAEALTFPDDSFDIVYAPYTISVVSDPVKAVHENAAGLSSRRPLVFLNHFLSSNKLVSRAERFISPLTVHVGFKADLDLPGVSLPGRARASVDRDGQHPPHLVARHLRQGRLTSHCLGLPSRYSASPFE